MILKLKWKIDGPHYKVALFSGPDKDHLSCCGVLVLYKEEAILFREIFYYTYNCKISIGNLKLIEELYEEGWDDTKIS